MLDPWRWMRIVYAYDREADTVAIATIQDGRAGDAATASAQTNTFWRLRGALAQPTIVTPDRQAHSSSCESSRSRSAAGDAIRVYSSTLAQATGATPTTFGRMV